MYADGNIKKLSVLNTMQGINYKFHTGFGYQMVTFDIHHRLNLIYEKIEGYRWTHWADSPHFERKSPIRKAA